MKNLHVAAEVAFPPDAVTQTFGFIGRRGSGKTYGQREELGLRAHPDLFD